VSVLPTSSQSSKARFKSCIMALCSRSSMRDSLTSLGSVIPLQALRLDMALPDGVLAPVECSHGRHWRIMAACLALASGVQLRMIEFPS